MSELALREYLPEQRPLATFWRQATEGTTYWRLLVPAKHLPGRVNALRLNDIPKDCLRRQEGTAIWQFLGDLERTKFAARVQSAGVRCLMDVDDNYLIPGPTVPGPRSEWSSTVRESMRPGRSGYSHQAHRLLLPSIDGLIVSTDELANRYDGLVPAGITVCPNSVDPDDWPPVVREARPLAVGYAASDSHYYDHSIVERALGWASGKVTLVKLGGNRRPWRWPHTQVPWTNDLAAYRKSLSALDVGLCPLQRSSWHDGKSDIKAMEYLMAGALPIVQGDSPCYRDWTDLVPSAATPKQWVRALKEVVAMGEDERHSIWKRAHEWLLEHKTIGRHIEKWRGLI